MKISIDDYQSHLSVFISLIALILFGLLIFISQSILTPVLVYILILLLYLKNSQHNVIKNIFYLSTIIFTLWFINELFSILIPFLIAFIFAYILNPLTNILTRKKFPRWFATLISVLLLLGLVGFLITIILPPLIEQISLLISSAPQTIAQLQTFFNDFILKEFEKIGIAYPELKKFISNELPSRVQELISSLLKNILSILSSVGVIFNQIINLVLIPIITFYFLKDYDKISTTLLNLFNEDFKIRLKEIGTKVDQIFGNYIKGFFIIALINGMVITVGLTILNVKYAMVLGLISALLCVIPYFGIIIGFATGFIISLVSGIESWKLIFIPILYFGENLIENSVYIPKIIGSRVGLHPLVILLALFVFGYFGGIFGMLIAVPTSALLISLFVKKKSV